MRTLLFAAFCCCALPVFANGDQETDLSAMASTEVVVLGEIHDNPHHHDIQAQLVADLNPGALVFEMLSSEQAAQVTGANRNNKATLETALGWDQTGWPDFALYYPIFAAAPEAKVYGAGLPRGAARDALKAGVVDYFGDDAINYGLDQPLDASEQETREAYQFAAHCDALPESMLPMMVDLQRLRDALLARAVSAALDAGDGSVVVITGNGHARKDRGMAVYLENARPDIAIFALGQSEAGEIEGQFDALRDSPKVERPDPCLEFQKQG